MRYIFLMLTFREPDDIQLVFFWRAPSTADPDG